MVIGDDEYRESVFATTSWWWGWVRGYPQEKGVARNALDGHDQKGLQIEEGRLLLFGLEGLLDHLEGRLPLLQVAQSHHRRVVALQERPVSGKASTPIRSSALPQVLRALVRPYR